MRGLSDRIRRAVHGLRARATEQHIADLQHQLHEMSAQRNKLDEDIDQAITRLLNAIQQRDALAKRQPQPMRSI